MLVRETNAIYCKNHMKHINTLYGQNAEIQYFKAGGTYRNTGLERVNQLMHKLVVHTL
jgi:hypothetical protein